MAGCILRHGIANFRAMTSGFLYGILRGEGAYGNDCSALAEAPEKIEEPRTIPQVHSRADSRGTASNGSIFTPLVAASFHPHGFEYQLRAQDDLASTRRFFSCQDTTLSPVRVIRPVHVMDHHVTIWFSTIKRGDVLRLEIRHNQDAARIFFTRSILIREASPAGMALRVKPIVLGRSCDETALDAR